MNMVGFVVQDDQIAQALDPFKDRPFLGREILCRLFAEQRFDGVCRRPFLLARLVDLMDVREEKISGRIRLGALAPKNDLDVPLGFPLGRDQRQQIEDFVVAKIFFQALVDDDVRRQEEKIGGKVRSGDHPFVKIGPDDEHGHDNRLPRTGGHFDGVPAEVLRGKVLGGPAGDLRNVAADLALAVNGSLVFDAGSRKLLLRAFGIKDFAEGLDQELCVFDFSDFDQIDQDFGRFFLAEVVTESLPVDEVIFFEPVVKQGARRPERRPDTRRRAIALRPGGVD